MSYSYTITTTNDWSHTVTASEWSYTVTASNAWSYTVTEILHDHLLRTKADGYILTKAGTKIESK